MDTAAFSRPLQSFISRHRRNGESLPHFFKRIFADPKLAPAILKVILKNPRSHRRDYEALRAVFSDTRSFCRWFFGEKGYIKAYTLYINFCWNKAEHIEEMLKLMPVFNPWSLKQRFGRLRGGETPAIFGSENDFLKLVDMIMASPAVKNYHAFKKIESRPKELEAAYPAAKKVNMYDFGEKRKFLCGILEKECGRSFKLKNGGHEFKIRFLCNPFSCKLVFRIEADNGEVYILKTLPYDFRKIPDDRKRKEHENHALRADSPYTNAMLEFYLKLNRCPHAPQILYYNYDYDTALYAEEKGEMLIFDDKPFYFHEFFEFNGKMLKDANKLGVYANDINYGNFLLSAADGQLKIIDIGHAVYADPLNPGIAGICMSLNNLCGRDFLLHYGNLFY